MKLKILINLLFLFCVLPMYGAVDIEVGLDGLTTTTRVDTPVWGKSTETNASQGPAAIPDPATRNVPASPKATDIKEHQHLAEPAEKNPAKKPEKASFPRTIGEGQAASLEQKGKGSSEYEAIADGSTEILVYLPTYNPARIIVRLYDLDGDEIFFKGKSLLVWERQDDKAFAPVFFQGNSDENSMKESSSNNYDAVQNSYKFDVQKGQRLRLEISGKPESKSYVRAKGPLDSI